MPVVSSGFTTVKVIVTKQSASPWNYNPRKYENKVMKSCVHSIDIWHLSCYLTVVPAKHQTRERERESERETDSGDSNNNTD